MALGGSFHQLLYHSSKAKTVQSRLVVNERINKGDVVRNVEDGLHGIVEKASCSEANAIGIATSSAPAGGTIHLAQMGLVRANFGSAPAASDNGKPVYLSATEGQCTMTMPTALGMNQIQLGYLLDGNGQNTSPLILLDIEHLSDEGANPDVHTFTNATSLTILHSKPYKPMVWISDSSGHQIDASVQYGSGSVTVTFCTALSGSVQLS